MRQRPARHMPRWLARMPLRLYDAGLGRVLGHRFLRLEHRGRRTGAVRSTVLEIVAHDPAGPVVVSGFGPHSQWFQNVVVDPEVHVTLGHDRYRARAHVLGRDEARAQLERYARSHPRAARRLASLYADDADPEPRLADLAGEALPVVRFERVA